MSGALVDLLNGGLLDIYTMMKTIIVGPSVFWFIFMLIPLYAASPILKHILQDKKISELYIALWFVFTLVVDSLVSTFLSGSKIWLPRSVLCV